MFLLAVKHAPTDGSNSGLRKSACVYLPHSLQGKPAREVKNFTVVLVYRRMSTSVLDTSTS
jgi:hypothetical protein